MALVLPLIAVDRAQFNGYKYLVSRISQSKYVYTFLFELPKKGPFENCYLNFLSVPNGNYCI